jgi:GDP-mannose 6-dehydrogenase
MVGYDQSGAAQRRMRVSVFGLGYVGAVSCACLARDGFHVIGVDVNPDKVQLINDGHPPVVEAEIGDLTAEAVRTGRLVATTDASAAVAGTEISLVCVGTPSAPNGSLSLDAVVRVVEQIGAALRSKADDHDLVIRSTVLPGTVKDLVIPALERASGKRVGHGVNVFFNPEFLREGSSVYDYDHPPFTLIGTTTGSAPRLARVYERVASDVLYVSIETAEMVKYVCNTFHALKIAFANEIGSISRSLGVDSHEVMDIVCRDTKLNISPRYLKPGFAFGGSCLPKDVRALIYRARQSDVSTPLVEAVLTSNRVQIERGIDAVLQLKARKVAMLGLSFKAGTDDLRESPLVTLAEALIGKGLDLRIYDEHVSIAKLMGANREYIQHEIPHISSLLVNTLEDAVAHGEVLIIGNAGQGFRRAAAFCRPGQAVVDLVRLDEFRHLPDVRYIGINW